MNVTMTEARLRPETTIDLLEVISMEGRHYMARYYIGEETFLLVGKDNRPLLFNGACEVRDAFHGFNIRETQIIPTAGPDEMIGMQIEEMTETRPHR